VNVKINKISQIKKIIKCDCGEGDLKLETIYIHPKNGKIMLIYSACNKCSHGWIKEGIRAGTPGKITMITDIIIPELALGE